MENINETNGTKRTLVISAFPGLGKTHLFNKFKEVKITALDSDSSLFSWKENTEPRERHPDFPNNYINHIKDNIGKVDIILVSSHKQVREALSAAGIYTYLVYPSKILFGEYIERYINRDSDKAFIKMMKTNFASFVDEIDNENLVNVYKRKTEIPETYLIDIVFEIHWDLQQKRMDDLKQNQTNTKRI